MKYNKIWRIITAVILSAIVMIPLPAAPAHAAPAISLSRSQGATGQVITISGAGFFASSTVSRGVHVLFGKYPASNTTVDYAADIHQRLQTFELRSDGTFSGSVTVPTRLDSGTVKEEVRRGTYYIYIAYWLPPSQFAPAFDDPAIQVIVPFTVVAGTIAIEPTSGPAGTEVTINGSYFGATENVTILYDSVSSNASGDMDTNADGSFGPAKIKIPPSIAGAHTIAVSGNNTGINVLVTFTVKPEIILSPKSNAPGSMITLKGSGFAGGSEVKNTFDGAAATPAVTDAFGSFSTAFPVPAKSPAVYNVASTDGSGNTAAASFTVTASGITIDPAIGTAGTQVVIKGNGFVTGRPVTITFNNVNAGTATVDAQGSFSASFAVPQFGTGAYQVKATDGTNTASAEFSITLSVDISPRTTLASPGYVGSELTIKGEGGFPDSAVIVLYDGKEVGSSKVLADKSFSVTFKIPASAPGTSREHTITATVGSDTRQFTFVMEASPPAAPVPLKPEMRARAVTATAFDWENSLDTSGVTYTLQIATAEDFSEKSIVLEKAGLETADYTLTKDEKLKSLEKGAAYYWRVRAVDGAGNIGAWSGAGIFFVGISLQLSQPVIYLAVGIGALALVIFAFWLGRRTSYY